MQQEERASRLAQGWQTVYEQSGQAIDWLAKARGSARRLDNEADHLILKLRRARNQAKSLHKVSQSASTVGFFGLSQAGKSYLISALAAGAQGRLETVLDGQRLDFLEHINPPGGGKEATGLVTRFTCRAQPQVSGFPLQLRLFTEVEIVKILVNSFFNDFNLEKAGFAFNADMAQQAHEAINTIEARRQPGRVDGISEDDVVDLWDYLRERYPWTIAALEGDFLPRLVELAPYLSLTDRATLFAFLWGRIDSFTVLFRQLSERLAQLGHTQTLFAPLQALVEPSATGAGFVQRDSIMNVDMLERLGQSDDTRLTVCRLGQAQQTLTHEIPRAELAALTAELTIALANEPDQAIFKSVDLLDFPGYRGRLKLESLDNLADAFARDPRANPVAQLFLRGKVAYLFERYTDLQEMNVLVVCTASHKQSDVADVGPVLSGWIKRTQGELAQQRASRPSGLVWAITMFDIKISDALSKSASLMETVWEDLIKMTMLERFQQYGWMQEWSPGQAFNNTFLLRKPRMPVTFLSVEQGNETGIQPATESALALMGQTFCDQSLVREHVADPEQAWQAMLSLNDGGITRLSQYLATVAVRDHKLARLTEQLQETVHDLVEGRLGPWFYHQGADEVLARRRVAQGVVDAMSRRAKLLGDFQASLLLSDDVLLALYLRSGIETPTESDVPAAAETVSDELDGALGLGMGLDLFGDASPARQAPVAKPATRLGSDARYARAVLREWIHHLRSLPEDTRLVRYLGVERKVLEQVSDELITAIARFDLESLLLQKVSETEQSGTKRERLADRQVLAVKTVLGDFVAWLGFDGRAGGEVVQSRANQGQPLFARPSRVPAGALPPIDTAALDFTRIYLADWLVALAHLIVGNAGHDAGREISAQLNAELGTILAALKAARMEVPAP